MKGGGRGGGVRRLMEKTILNFHFDYLTPSLSTDICPFHWDLSGNLFTDQILKTEETNLKGGFCIKEAFSLWDSPTLSQR